jgi:site-specific recombinase XerD
MDNEQLLSKLDKYQISFLNEKKTLNSSKNTITTYIYVLESFYEFIVDSNVKNIEDINKEIILSFLNKEPKSSINTKILRLAVLKSFLKFIDEAEQLSGLFELRFKKLTIKQEHKEVDALSEGEQKRLLALFDKKTSSFNKTRDSLLVKLLLFTGIRATECLDIRLSDITLIESHTVFKIKIEGKGLKQRFVYISADKINYELNFMREKTNSYIAITNQLKRMSRVGLYNVISNKMKKALIDKSGVHILRHTMARNLVSKNINLKTVSELLGHQDIVLTAKTYARSNEENKIQAII